MEPFDRRVRHLPICLDREMFVLNQTLGVFMRGVLWVTLYKSTMSSSARDRQLVDFFGVSDPHDIHIGVPIGQWGTPLSPHFFKVVCKTPRYLEILSDPWEKLSCGSGVFLVKPPLINPFFVQLISVSDKLWPVKLEFVVSLRELHPTKSFHYLTPPH